MLGRGHINHMEKMHYFSKNSGIDQKKLSVFYSLAVSAVFQALIDSCWYLNMASNDGTGRLYQHNVFSRHPLR